jgi:3-oxoadipate enol-lactonase
MPLIKAGSININYEVFGEGEPLLLIMGFGMPGAAWLPTLPLLAGFKCIYFDNRGTGFSDKPDGVYTIADMAGDASNLLEALNVPRAKVMGVSMGGMIAQELALHYPKQVEKTVLGCTTPGGPHAAMPAPDIIERLVTGSKLMASEPERGFDLIAPLLVPQEFLAAHPELRQMMAAAMKLMPPTPAESIDRTVAGIMAFNAYDRLPQISCPVLVVHGDCDVLIPSANAKILSERIPHAELYMIPGAGHAFQAADPVGITARIAAWLRS